MGITGLIPFLEKASSKIHLKDIRGTTVAVDTYCWLHKGVFSCAEKLVRGEDTDLYIQYCMKYVQMLLSYDIKPILVFDGQHLPAKALTERRRRESRQQSKKRAAELLRLGRMDEARSHMRRCVDVTHEMALRLICECRMKNVDCIVAPYEADAQMAWLNKVNIAQYIVTEDSDLTLFGAQKIIFKLDLSASGLLVDSKKLHLAMNCREEKYSFDKFRRMCILSGCDYLDSLPGIGLAKACKFILKVEPEMDMRKALKRIPEYLNMKNLEVNDEYIENFFKAEATFKHMYIYNPLERCMERLHPLSEYETDIRYCSNAGTLMEDCEQALHLALGNLNPFSLQQMDKWHPDNAVGPTETKQNFVKRSKLRSIWQSNYVPHNTIKSKPDDKCALFFKKVDFSSKTIGTEIEENNRKEDEKPNEADIFCMYTRGKKRRHISSSDTELEKEGTLSTSPGKPKMSHNPFAKSQKSADLQSSPVICENASLLRLLSPKKSREVAAQQDSQHTLAKCEILPEKRQSEVRSRFFVGTIKEASKRSIDDIDRNLINKINDIENTATSYKKLQFKLYSPPTKTQPFIKNGSLSTLLSSKDKAQNVISEENEVGEESSRLIDKTDTVFVSNDSTTQQSLSFSQSTSSSSENNFKSLTIKHFKMESAPRLGLSKQKSVVKSSKKSTKTAKFEDSRTIGQNQTRLSMFGFQKRPTLK